MPNMPGHRWHEDTLIHPILLVVLILGLVMIIRLFRNSRTPRDQKEIDNEDRYRIRNTELERQNQILVREQKANHEITQSVSEEMQLLDSQKMEAEAGCRAAKAAVVEMQDTLLMVEERYEQMAKTNKTLQQQVIHQRRAIQHKGDIQASLNLFAESCEMVRLSSVLCCALRLVLTLTLHCFRPLGSTMCNRCLV